MRPSISFRLLAALLACGVAVSAPALVLAHGEAHGHERHTAEETAAGPTDSAAPAAQLLVGAVDHDPPAHPGLHEGCLAKLASNVTLAPGLASVSVATLPGHADAGDDTPAAEDRPPAAARAAPPDQPRAPPAR